MNDLRILWLNKTSPTELVLAKGIDRLVLTEAEIDRLYDVLRNVITALDYERDERRGAQLGGGQLADQLLLVAGEVEPDLS